jgi:hypothetical protein
LLLEPQKERPPQRDSQGQAFETQQTESSIDDFTRESVSATDADAALTRLL